MSTKIEWTEETYNPIIGCSKVSPGCDHCYAERMAFRLANMHIHSPYLEVVNGENWAHFKNPKHGWNGKTHLVESALEKPLHWRKPRTIFVCSMGDLFHESVPFEWIDKVMAVIAMCPQHTFLLLTKRPKKMDEYFSRERLAVRIMTELDLIAEDNDLCYRAMEAGSEIAMNGLLPLSNVWLGVTAENQEQADKRIPILLQIPAVKRFVSIEPMLGPVDIGYIKTKGGDHIDSLNGMEYFTVDHTLRMDHRIINKLDWVICGAESGPGRRDCKYEWVRDLLDQCREAKVPFFLKQLFGDGDIFPNKKYTMPEFCGRVWDQRPEA